MIINKKNRIGKKRIGKKRIGKMNIMIKIISQITIDKHFIQTKTNKSSHSNPSKKYPIKWCIKLNSIHNHQFKIITKHPIILLIVELLIVELKITKINQKRKISPSSSILTLINNHIPSLTLNQSLQIQSKHPKAQNMMIDTQASSNHLNSLISKSLTF